MLKDDMRNSKEFISSELDSKYNFNVGSFESTIWESKFGDTFIMEWGEFIAGLGLNLTPEEEKNLQAIIGL